MSFAHTLPSVEPTRAKPAHCENCKRRELTDKRPIAIHWSYLRKAWLCLWCHFEAPAVECQC